MKKKIAFITGITGMVGSHLLDYLIKNTNWEIHGLVRWRSSLENIEDHIENINKKIEKNTGRISTKILAILSLFSWFGAITAGRLIAYIF